MTGLCYDSMEASDRAGDRARQNQSGGLLTSAYLTKGKDA
jgi:hypothetical protein